MQKKKEDKCQHPFENPNKKDVEGYFFNTIKTAYEKPM
jgi:hypothetical protein